QGVGLGLHAAHRQLACRVHGLRQHAQLLALRHVGVLEADVVDRRADHQPDRIESGLLHEQELVDRQIAREECLAAPTALGLAYPLNRLLGKLPTLGGLPARSALSSLPALFRHLASLASFSWDVTPTLA